MDERARFEALLRLLDELAEENEEAPILVEGQRDVAALRALGCAGEIVPLKQGAPIAEVAHALALRWRRVVLLPDWDEAGRALRDLAVLQLASHGVRADLRYHERMVRDTELALKDVETLLPHVARGLRKFHERSIEEHLRARGGDPLGVATLREEFPPADAAPPPGRARSRRRKRRARPDEER